MIKRFCDRCGCGVYKQYLIENKFALINWDLCEDCYSILCSCIKGLATPEKKEFYNGK